MTAVRAPAGDGRGRGQKRRRNGELEHEQGQRFERRSGGSRPLIVEERLGSEERLRERVARDMELHAAAGSRNALQAPSMAYQRAILGEITKRDRIAQAIPSLSQTYFSSFAVLCQAFLELLCGDDVIVVAL